MVGFFTETNIEADGPACGDIVTKESEYIDPRTGLLYYNLKEWPCDKEGYQAGQFVPINEPEEKMVEVTFTKITKESPVSVN